MPNKRYFSILSLTLLSSLLLSFNVAPDPLILAVDGPYVFLEKEKTTVRYVGLKDNSLLVSVEEYPQGTTVPPLTCGIDQSPMPAFEFELQKEITPPPSSYPQPEKLYAISDIEGNFDAFAQSLQANGLISNDYHWTYGTGHLVLVGDFFDRGINVTACLWLIYKLEQEALAAGGRVHFIIGNHEEMNLRGDLRYLKEKYQQVADKLGVRYTRLYGKNSELGRWLRTKNVIEKIGQTIFVHGGLSIDIASSGLSIEEINDIARSAMGLSLEKIKFKGKNTALVFDTDKGPTWYRGYFQRQFDESALTVILATYNALRVVVGHTVMDEISSFYGEKLIAIDVNHAQAVDIGKCNAMLMEGDRVLKVNSLGQKFPIRIGDHLMNPKPIISHSGLYGQLQMEARLLQAIREGDMAHIKKDLTSPRQLNARYTTKKYTLLHYAIKYDQIEIARHLLETGADMSSFFNDETPLMFAISNQNTKMLNLLIDKGAKINQINQQGQNALFYVAQFGTVNNARLLIDKGADFNQLDQQALKPYDYALRANNTPVAHFLQSLE